VKVCAGSLRKSSKNSGPAVAAGRPIEKISANVADAEKNASRFPSFVQGFPPQGAWPVSIRGEHFLELRTRIRLHYCGVNRGRRQWALMKRRLVEERISKGRFRESRGCLAPHETMQIWVAHHRQITPNRNCP